MRFKILIFGLLLSTSVFSSEILRKVIVLNEGAFGGPVYAGYYDPATHIYTNFDTIQARFASDVLIDGNHIYIAADSLLLKYDLLTLVLLDSEVVPHIRELAVWNNLLLVTRGNYFAAVPSFFQAYQKSDLSLAYELTTLSGDAAELKVLNDTAYVAVNDFGAMGKLAVVDLQNQVLNREIDLGPEGFNPEAVRIQSNEIVVVSSPNFNNTGVSRYNSLTTTIQGNLLGTSNGCAASALHGSDVFFQVTSENKLRVFSTLSTTVWDSLEIQNSVYGLGIDGLNGRIYCGITDFSTFGKVMVYDFYGMPVDSFSVEVSPGTFAFDYMETTSLKTEISNPEFLIFPNPGLVSSEIRISGFKEKSMLTISDITGREWARTNVNIENFSIPPGLLEPGIYFISVQTGSKKVTKKVILL